MTYRRARSLDVFLAEANRMAPRRRRGSDGWIGDAAHATTDSDHNPWVKDSRGVGVVRAQDITHDPRRGFDAGQVAVHVALMLGRHPALGSGAYVIFNRRIISTDRLPEGWRTYRGRNPHTKHVHVSVGRYGYDSITPWGLVTDDWSSMATEKEIRDIIRSEVAGIPTDVWGYRNARLTTRQAYSHLLDGARNAARLSALSGAVAAMASSQGVDPAMIEAAIERAVADSVQVDGEVLAREVATLILPVLREVIVGMGDTELLADDVVDEMARRLSVED